MRALGVGDNTGRFSEGGKPQVDNHEHHSRAHAFEAVRRHAVRSAGRVVRAGAFGCALAVVGTVALAEDVVPDGELCVINVRADDKLNVRIEPNPDSSVVTRVAPNECGLIVAGACQRYWCPVEKNGATGWVNRRFISTVSPARYCVSGVGSYDKLVMRASPSLQASVLVELPSYQCNISLLPFSTNGWQKVRLEEWEGWVTRKYLSSR
jgi:SH3-like domain-containing protein